MSEDKKSTDTPATDSTEEQSKSIKADVSTSEPVSGAINNSQAEENNAKVDADKGKSGSQESKVEKPARKKGKPGLFILVLLVFLIAFFGGGYFAYSYIENKTAESNEAQSIVFNSNLDSVQQQVSDLRVAIQNFQRNQSSMQTSFTALQSESERQMQALAQRISSNESTGVADWTLAEVEYLLNIANQRLATSKDSQTAIEMLEQADSILFELAYPELAPVRRQISEDLTALRLAKRVDTEGLYFELDALSNQLIDLTEFSPEYLPLKETSEVEGDTWYQKLWSSSTNTLSRFVRVQTKVGEPEYLVSDEQATSRRLSIQLQLRQAQLALLSSQQAVYKGALDSASGSLVQYYPNSEKALTMSDRLSELAGISVSSEAMNINGSIRALSSVVDQLSKAGNTAVPE